MFYIFFFFFFQAEDGIRDYKVTGVQTCALPIYEHRAGVLVAARHELEQEYRPGPANRQIADVVKDHETREDQGPETVAQPAGLLGVLERRDEVGERGVVDAAPALGRSDRVAEGQVGLPTPGGPRKTTFSRRSMKLSVWRLSSWSRLTLGCKLRTRATGGAWAA